MFLIIRSPILVLIIATLLYLASIPPFLISPFYYISFLLIFINFLKNKNFNLKFIFLFFLLIYFFSLSWIAESFYTGGLIYTLLGYLMVFLLSAFLAFLNSLLIFFFNFYLSNKIIKIILIPLSIVLIEILKEFLFGGFPWNPSAIIWIDNFYLNKISSIIGIYGTSILVHLTISISIILIEYKKKFHFFILMLFIFFLYFVSFLPVKSFESNIDNDKKQLSILIIQSNIKQSLRSNSVIDNLKTYEELTKKALAEFPSSDIVIWPEGSINIDLNNKKPLLKRIGNIINSNQKIIMGSNAIQNSKLYNRMYVINNEGVIEQFYDKQKLVLFGEYVPIVNTYISKFLEIGMNFSKGTNKKKLQLPKNFVASPMICFESIFDSSQIHSEICNSDLIIQISNDSWFGDKYGPIQHFKNSILRSSEKNMTLVRSTPSGITAVINPNAQILKSIPQGDQGYINFKIHKTFNEKKCSSFILFNLFFLILIFTSGLIYDRSRS